MSILENAKEKIVKRIRELGKQQLISELGCIIDQKSRFGPNVRRMKCLFDSAGLGSIETNASQVDIDGKVELEIHDARKGFLPDDGIPTGTVVSELKGKKRFPNGIRFVKSGLTAKGFEYKDKEGSKWQIPLTKHNKNYNIKMLLTPPEGSDLWCRVSGGFGGSYVGVGQKVKCDVRPHRSQHSII